MQRPPCGGLLVGGGGRGIIYSDPIELVDKSHGSEAYVNFFVPEGALKVIPIFKGREKVEIIQGLRELVEKSSSIQLGLIEEVMRI